MAQLVALPDPELEAMALPLSAIEPLDLGGRQFGVSSDGVELWQPTFKGRPIALDLAPGGNWLDVSSVGRDLTTHFGGEAARTLCVAVSLGVEDQAKLDCIDDMMKRVRKHSSIRGNVLWKHMHCGQVVLHLVLADTAQPTVLKFVKGVRVLKGVGKDFLDSCLEGRRLEDFICKPKVLLECMRNTSDYITITVTVLSIIFAPAPRRVLVTHTEEEDAEAIQAVKRLKWQF